MEVEQANKELRLIIKKHLSLCQGGDFGKATLKDLQFLGKLHTLLEDE